MNHKIDASLIAAGTTIAALFIITDSPVFGFVSVLIMFASLPIDDK